MDGGLNDLWFTYKQHTRIFAFNQTIGQADFVSES